MILTGPRIAAAIDSGAISFSPFAAARLNPNSIDLHLGSTIRDYAGMTIDARAPIDPPDRPIPDDGFWLEPGRLYTAPSRETFGSHSYVPIVHGKSNIARAGLFVHVNGDMVDVGRVEPFVFQLVPVIPVRIAPGMAIAQVTFWTIDDSVD